MAKILPILLWPAGSAVVPGAAVPLVRQSWPGSAGLAPGRCSGAPHAGRAHARVRP